MSDIPEPVCPRHPDRVSHLMCRRCGRPACPDCQHATGTWFDCVDCVAAAEAPHGRVPHRSDGSAGGVAEATDEVVEPGAGGRGSAADPPVAEGATALPARRRPQPLVTYGLIGLCTAVYLWQRSDPAVTDVGEFSAVAGYREPWRFLTAAFLHSPDTVSHLFFNMLSLFSMGQFLEPVLGRAKYFALYLLSALGGSVGCLLLVPRLDVSDQSSLMAWFEGMVGASGAVFGLFTAVFFVLRWVKASVAGMVVLLAINVALPLYDPNIAWQAHVGGAVVGLITAAVLLVLARAGRQRAAWPALAGIAVVLIASAWAKYALNATVLRYVLAQVGVAG